MSVKNFLQSYRKYLILSIILHLLISIGFSIEFIHNKTLHTQEVPLREIADKSVKAVAIDENKVNSLVLDIQKQENDRKKTMVQAKKSLELTKKTKASEARKLQKLKNEQAILQKKLKKMAAHQAQELKKFKDKEKEFNKISLDRTKELQEIEQKKSLAKKELQDLSSKAADIEKQNIEKKKLIEEKNRIIEQQTIAVIKKYSDRIESSISNNFISTNEDIAKNLSCKVKIFLSPSGEVIKTQLIKSSGDQYFDKRAILAIKKSSPLPVPDDKKIFNKMSEIILNCKPQTLIAHKQ